MADRRQQKVDGREAEAATGDISVIPANFDPASAADRAVFVDGYDMMVSAQRRVLHRLRRRQHAQEVAESPTHARSGHGGPRFSQGVKSLGKQLMA